MRYFKKPCIGILIFFAFACKQHKLVLNSQKLEISQVLASKPIVQNRDSISETKSKSKQDLIHYQPSTLFSTLAPAEANASFKGPNPKLIEHERISIDVSSIDTPAQPIGQPKHSRLTRQILLSSFLTLGMYSLSLCGYMLLMPDVGLFFICFSIFTMILSLILLTTYQTDFEDKTDTLSKATRNMRNMSWKLIAFFLLFALFDYAFPIISLDFLPLGVLIFVCLSIILLIMGFLFKPDKEIPYSNKKDNIKAEKNKNAVKILAVAGAMAAFIGITGISIFFLADLEFFAGILPVLSAIYFFLSFLGLISLFLSALLQIY